MMPLERTGAFTFVCVAGFLPRHDDRAPWAVQRSRTLSTNLCPHACGKKRLLGAALRLRLLLLSVRAPVPRVECVSAW